jgi:hypothetical protein
MSTTKIYPGELATPAQLMELATEYQKAAEMLLTLGRRQQPLSRAPFRLTAIHAIELYLNAYLLHRQHSPAELRGLQHDFGARANMAIANGLVLRTRTLNHLQSMDINREYLVSRYGPELASSSSQINRLMATLSEVATKISAKMTADDSVPNAMGGSK